ncbi:hypothetical protein [Paucisalibacillus globulus]|uniref:hypothetical protein n=1 Tax=Paucisalibacillus globulus TaxID=351095 RepID=UPI000BB7F083|nr:hypothetical protein [Paucisalibacillus globulus]
MSWKSVEMQVALPRTMDAGKLQEQSLKQNQHFQEALAQTQLIQENIKRKRVQDSDEVMLQKDSQNQKNEEKYLQKKQTSEAVENINHPFLGNNFDSRS